MPFILKANDILPNSDMVRSRILLKSSVSAATPVTVYVASNFGDPSCRRMDLTNEGASTITFAMQGGANFGVPGGSPVATVSLAAGESAVFYKNDGYNDVVMVEKAASSAPVVFPDGFLYDVFTWTGSQSIPDASFQNFFALSGITKAAGGTAGITMATNLAMFPAKTKPSGVTFSTRISGTVTGPAGTSREWKTQTRRPDGVTVVGSDNSIKENGTDIANRDIALMSHTTGAIDPFTTQGIMLGIFNDSGAAMTITSVSVRIYRNVNPE